MLPELTAPALHARLAAGEAIQLIDVREDIEFAYCQLPGSVHIPLGEVPRRAAEINSAGPVVLICHHGVRSAQALGYLQHRLGYQNLLNLKGGIDAWSRDVDPSVPVY
jgi:rhodanese-related sulfurtransferase